MSDDTRMAALDALLDKQALLECVTRYARGLDRMDDELVLSAFHPDARFDNGAVTGTREDFLAWLSTQQGGRETVMHHLTTASFDLDGDSAHGETYYIAVWKQHASGSVDAMGGRYVDRFERRNGEWRISARVLVREWHLLGDASSMDAVLDSGLRIATRDRTDVSYVRPLTA